ncbi:MAG: ABC transporter ATP-binding protein [Firmicutes bacterium]|nr:ABC transporter ATP-binding protein [Bacillota bacterium]
MKKLVKYLKPYWKMAVLAPLLMMVEVLMELMQPKLMASIVDNGITNGDIPFILKTGLLMIAISIIGVGGGIGATYFSSKASQNFGADLRLDLFKKVQSFSFDALDKFRTASLVTRLTNDVVQVQNAVLFMLRMLVRAPLLCIGGIIMALTINIRLSIIILVTMPLLILSITFVMKKGFLLFTKVQERLDKVNTVVQENLAGVRVVKAFVRSEYENRRFATANQSLTDITIKAARIVGAIMPLNMLIMNGSVIAIIWFGGIKVNTGEMLVGEIMAYITYMTQILFSLMMVAFIFTMITRAKASADRIIEVLNTEGEATEPTGAELNKAVSKPLIKEMKESVNFKGRVEFKNVSFKYKGATGDPVLKNITFTAMPGETIAIIGPTGSGKSTLVNLIPRFYEVTEGSILIDGIDIRDIDLEELRKNIGVVLQESILFTGTIMDNIRWGCEEASEEEVIEAAKAAQAHNFIMEFPDKYNTVLGQRGVNVSGGQKQRISIARALLKKPAILIMDDSTSAIDMETEARIQSALKNLMKNSTCFVIAQRISTVMEADRIIVLEDGKIVDMGTHEELLQTCRVYQDIYNSQLGGRMVAYV